MSQMENKDLEEKVAVLNEAYAAKTSSEYNLNFSISPDGTVSCHSNPIPKYATLEASVRITDKFLHEDPMRAEMQIRKHLAEEIAKKLIEEDLINIMVSDYPWDDIHTAKTTFKIIQE